VPFATADDVGTRLGRGLTSAEKSTAESVIATVTGLIVDDELVATAKHRGAYVHAHGSIVEHLHPMAGKAPMDELYERQRSRMRFGRRLFRLREPLWS
jgi:hypothetical protein